MTAMIILTVAPARPEDASRGVARLDPADLARLGGVTGAVISLAGARTAYARALPLPPDARGQNVIQADANLRANAALALGQQASIKLAAPLPAATTLRLAAPPGLTQAALQKALLGVPASDGDLFRLTLVDGAEAECRIEHVAPTSPATPTPSTRIELASAPPPPHPDRVRYEDLGGLGLIVDQVREVLEWPLKQPQAFARLGIVPPKGVLLSGPPGTGKTMIARAVAAETSAHFIAIAAPEIMDKHYGASEQQLRQVFETARARAPAVIFIDEIDAIAPKREALSGEKQVERRIVAQLLALMDGLAARGEVLVLAATNMPDAIDPALRRPGRFDREIVVPPPDRAGRAEILAVHTRAMPLAADVALPALADATHGYVGADLAALCREAAIAALRRAGLGRALLAESEIAALTVSMADFGKALRAITPTALREAFTEIPAVAWSEIAGLDRVRDELERAVLLPLRAPDVFARLGIRPPRGVLLYGPPGTGKTLLARALASSAEAGFISVRGPELLAEWQGASERALRDLFRRARLAAPCILFFDEIDAITPARGGRDGATIERMVAQFLTEMDGITEPAGVVVLGATNRPDRIDPALLRPGRFDIMVEIARPDESARAALLRLHGGRLPLAAGFRPETLAPATNGFTGADIAGLCRRAALAALGRAGPSPTLTITEADFAASLAATRAQAKSEFT
jgi:transitional endoplasmic reticulum ATPase